MSGVNPIRRSVKQLNGFAACNLQKLMIIINRLWQKKMQKLMIIINRLWQKKIIG